VPISRDAFNKGARSADLERDIVTYLERHPDQAFTLEEIGGATDYLPFEVDPLQRDVYYFSVLAVLWKLSDNKKVQHRIVDHVGYYSLAVEEPATEDDAGGPKE
jgi:hypothetical protein